MTQKLDERMAKAIEAAMPIIREMWTAFPYAEMENDDDIITELAQSAKSYRESQTKDDLPK